METLHLNRSKINDIVSRELVLEAVKKDAYALEFVSDEFKRDHEIVLASIKSMCGCVLEHVSDELKNDREFVLKAIKIDNCVIDFVNPKFRDDPEIKYIANNYVKHIDWMWVFRNMVIVSKFIKLYDEIRFRPGNTGYLEAKTHFESLKL